MGLASAVIGIISLIFLIQSVHNLCGPLKKIFNWIIGGIICSYLIILSIFLSDLEVISLTMDNVHILSEILWAIAALFTLIGAAKMYNLLKYVPSSYFERISEAKENISKKSYSR